MTLTQLKTKMIWDTVYYLVERAKEIIEKARRTKETDNISGTQWDSYGAAVFFNGRIYYTLRSADPAKDLTRMNHKRTMETYDGEQGGRHRGYKDIPEGTGREWVKMYVDEIKKTTYIPKKGFALIVFNAAFYSGIQERSQGYSILSQIMGDMQTLGKEFKGSTLTDIP